MSTPQKFRKKPVVIEAVLAGAVLDDVSNRLNASPPWIVRAFEGAVIGFEMHAVLINTLEGQMRAERADWIIQGVKGELYPCKADIFEMTYERDTGATFDLRVNDDERAELVVRDGEEPRKPLARTILDLGMTGLTSDGFLFRVDRPEGTTVTNTTLARMLPDGRVAAAAYGVTDLERDHGQNIAPKIAAVKAAIVHLVAQAEAEPQATEAK